VLQIYTKLNNSKLKAGHTHTHTHTQTAFLIPNKNPENMMQIARRVLENEHERYKNTTVQTKTEKESSRTISRDKWEFRQKVLLHLQAVIASNLIKRRRSWGRRSKGVSYVINFGARTGQAQIHDAADALFPSLTQHILTQLHTLHRCHTHTHTHTHVYQKTLSL
jgi:hypothetical protein